VSDIVSEMLQTADSWPRMFAPSCFGEQMYTPKANKISSRPQALALKLKTRSGYEQENSKWTTAICPDRPTNVRWRW